MNNHDFVATIKEAVRDAAITDTIDVLRNPPGRKPSQRMTERAEWYGSLDDEQRRILAGLIGDAVHNAIFGFLCVLDGVRAVESGPVKGTFELRYSKDGVTKVLNSADEEMLHDLFNEPG